MINAQYFQSKVALGLFYGVEYVKDQALRLQQQRISQLRNFTYEILQVKILSEISLQEAA